ncbi:MULTISPECIES: hypothetical protein [Rhodococcus]|uniref:Uncharacterized protein n=2 Tax=Rhodococcus TaxID=1827 RepID=A0A076F1D5_RHOOP|nr:MULTISPECIES: hypothetical protein [Rhodococcus]AII11212.1 hypothetical protein EP51_45040 [Rhodococcus opacus]QSE87628.1 hypothetical protein JWS13_02925 [Rhodococcus pseudokoreensis]
MTTSAMPVLTVPGTDEATAALADWLIRSLVPTVLDGAGMASAADDLCGLAPITCRHIARPRGLRGHERQVLRVIDSIESALRRPPVMADTGEAPLDLAEELRPIPEAILDAAAHIGGTIADIGSPVAALANRLLLLAAIPIGSGWGTMTPEQVRAQATASYCSLLTYLWRHDPGAQISLKGAR